MHRVRVTTSEGGDPSPKSDAIRVAVIASAYNRWITEPMSRGAEASLERMARERGRRGVCEVFDAPGAFELPVLAANAIRTGRFDAVVCIGCVIKGQTRHDEVIADSIANAIQGLACKSGVPIGFGVLTTENAEQAEARAGGAMGNKGAEAMEAAVSSFLEIERMRAGAFAAAESTRVS